MGQAGAGPPPPDTAEAAEAREALWYEQMATNHAAGNIDMVNDYWYTGNSGRE